MIRFLLPFVFAAVAWAQPRALFRAGQTFLTWPQVSGEGVVYRVLRSTTPAPNDAIATLDDSTGLNLMASINRMDLSHTKAPKEYEIPKRVYYVIEEGKPALSPSTGLFVYTAKRNETAYYAVAAMSQGREVKRYAITDPVHEKVEPTEAVRQNDEVDYVHWTAGGVGFNFRVHAPRGKGPYALIGVLHGALFQYNTPDSERFGKLDGAEGDTAVRVSLDAPLIRGKIKGIAVAETPMSSWTSEAVVSRVLWTLDWVQRHYAVDPDRVSLRGESMGGMGSVIIALQHPQRFAAIHAYVPVFNFRNSSMMPIKPIDYVKAHPEIDFPFILYTAGRTDHIVGWPDKLEFARAAEEARHPYIFYWDPRGHTYAGKVPVVWGEPNGAATAPLPTFSRKLSFPAIADLTANSDPGTVNLAVRPDQRPPLDSPGAGDLVGTMNGMVTWDKISDTAKRYEITLRLAPSAKVDSATATVTPRRMQHFKASPQQKFRYRVTGAGKAVKGEASADTWGHVTIRGVPITKAGNRLEIW